MHRATVWVTLAFVLQFGCSWHISPVRRPFPGVTNVFRSVHRVDHSFRSIRHGRWPLMTAPIALFRRGHVLYSNGRADDSGGGEDDAEDELQFFERVKASRNQKSRPDIDLMLSIAPGSPAAENVSPEIDTAEYEDMIEDAPSPPVQHMQDYLQDILSEVPNPNDTKVTVSYPDFGTLESRRMSEEDIREFLDHSIPIPGRKFSESVLSSTALYNFQKPPAKLQSFSRWLANRKKELLQAREPSATPPRSEWPKWVYEVDKPHPYLDPANGKFIAERDELPPQFQQIYDWVDSTEPIHVDHETYSVLSPDIVGHNFDFPLGLSYNPITDAFPGAVHNTSDGLCFYMERLNRSDPEDLELLRMRERGDSGNITAVLEEDDKISEHDIKFHLSIEAAVRRATPHLFDHLAAAEYLFFQNNTMVDNFLPALMPFPEINYTNTLMEFHTFKQLMPAPTSHPRKRYENSTFEIPNDEWTFWKYHLLRREVETWEPSDPSEHFINETVVEAIRPVLNVVGNVMKLVSTKDDFFRYEYYGPIREIIGMRAYVEYITKHVYPPCKGVRLETERTVDERDLPYPFWGKTMLWDIDKALPGEEIANDIYARQVAKAAARAAKT